MTQGGAGIASGNDNRGQDPAPGPKTVASGQAALGRTAALAGLLLAVAIAAFGWTVWQDARREAAASGNGAIVAEAERFLSMMTSIETSTRGFVIAGTEEFLAPFRQNVADLPAQLVRMENVWDEGGGDPARLTRLRTLADQQIAFETEIVRLRTEEGMEAAAELVRSGAGLRLMNDVRAEVGTAQANAQARVDLADATAHRNDLISNVAFLAAILSAGALAFVAFRRHVESRRASGMLSAVLENSPVAIGFVGRDGRLGRLNPAFAQAGGSLGREVALSDSLLDLFPHDRVMLERMLDETLRWGRVHNGIELRAGADEAEQIYLASIYPLRVEGRIAHETVGAGVVLTNATKRLRAERRLTYSETRFRSLIEATSAIVWSVPSSGRFSGDQPGWAAFTGQTEEQYSGFGWTDAVHPEDRQRSAEAWKQAVASESTYKIEHRVRRADGEWRDMIGRAVPIRAPDGTIAEWVGTHTDITDQKRIAAQLGHSNEQFRIIADNIPQFAWIADPKGDIDWYNQRWFDYTGTTLEEMRGHGWMKVHHPDHLDRVREQLMRSFAEGVKWEDSFPLRGADGHYRWFLAQAIPIRDETGTITRWFGTNTDITSQRAAEQELAAAKEAAENANRAKSQFIANMSHELRTPLSAVIGYAEMLEEEVEDLGEAHLLGDLKKIEQNARHLLSLINDVLDLSKIEAERMDVYAERFQLGDVMDEVASTVGSLMSKKNNRLVVEKDGALGEVHTDQVKLRQCLINLLSNAAKFTEEGTITLSARREPQDGGDWIRLEVTDTGIGMTPEQLERLFERFAQADESTTRKFGGTGLGLAITRAFCRLLGGDIGVTSEEGRGTTFTIRIPAEVEVPVDELAPEVAASETPVEGGAGLVLAIDDDPHARELVTRFLLREGFSVRTAADGLSGLEMARLLKPDVILLDVTMPKMDGWAVLTELKGDPEVAGIPVVMITIIDEHSLGYALGAADYLLKPVEWNRLKAVLDRFRTADNGLILAVDDDEDGLHRTATMLEREGLKVITALNGREALARMEDERPGLILLDLVMPEMDGFAFLKAMRAKSEWRGIPVVVLTSKDLTADELRFLQGQAQDIFTKGDVDLRELAAEIRVMVGQRAAPGPDQLAQTGQSGSEPTT